MADSLASPFLLEQHAEFIVAVVLAVDKPELQERLAELMQSMAECGSADLVGAIYHLWQGQRCFKRLSQGLNETKKNLLKAIHEATEFPTTLTPYLNLLDQQWTSSKQRLLNSHLHLTLFATLATEKPALQSSLEPLFTELIQTGWQEVVLAIQAIWQGERNKAALVQAFNLDDEDCLIIQTILDALHSPAFFNRLVETVSQQKRQSCSNLKKQHYLLINAVVIANYHENLRASLLASFQHTWVAMVEAIQQIWQGERQESVLCAQLNSIEQLIIKQILLKLQNITPEYSLPEMSITLHH